LEAVLGIDAAWTSTNPSGIALVKKTLTGWQLTHSASSYDHFLALADTTLASPNRPCGSVPQVSSLLAAAKSLCGRAVDLIAIDIPLAHCPIRGRRVSDNEVSKAYGSRKCGTHSPTCERPGKLGEALTQQFASEGYPLRTQTATKPCVIEVYPHPALVELTGASERLPYKFSKTKKYWPALTVEERRACLFAKWAEIITSLAQQIDGVTEALGSPNEEDGGRLMKAHEDRLDAVICAWVGVCALEGKAKAFGDKESAIWIPTPSRLL
jgi:predicted RNase H-like nuclease